MDDNNNSQDEPSSLVPDIEGDIKDFAASIKAISRSQPLAMSMLTMTHAMLTQKHIEFLKANCEVEDDTDDEESFTAKIPYEHIHRWSRERNELQNLERAQVILPPTYVVALVSQLDFFLGKLLRWIFWVKPDILNSSDRTLTLAQLSEFATIDDARDMFIEKEVETFLRKSHTDQFKWLEERLSLPLRKDLPSWPTYIELTERRNLFVHANGRVSRNYLHILSSVGLSTEGISLGDRLPANREYFKCAYECIFEIAFKLAQVVWRKLEPGNAKKADQNFLEIQYELLLTREYSLASLLGQFYRKCIKRPSSDEYRRMILVNEAIALLHENDDQECEKLLKTEDWSSCSLKFRLAVSVLLFDIDDAISKMEEIGSTGDVDKHAYANWPLFNKFRAEPRFLDTYEKIFGEKLEISEAFKTQKPKESDVSSVDAPESMKKLMDELTEKTGVTKGCTEAADSEVGDVESSPAAR